MKTRSNILAGASALVLTLAVAPSAWAANSLTTCTPNGTTSSQSCVLDLGAATVSYGYASLNPVQAANFGNLINPSLVDVLETGEQATFSFNPNYSGSAPGGTELGPGISTGTAMFMGVGMLQAKEGYVLDRVSLVLEGSVTIQGDAILTLMQRPTRMAGLSFNEAGTVPFSLTMSMSRSEALFEDGVPRLDWYGSTALGGLSESGSVNFRLTRATFTVNAIPTPEPATWGLMGLGLAAAAAGARLRRQGRPA